MSKGGMVYLVGAGPGDPGLVTLRARELVERCDVLVMDQLVDARLAGWVKPGCEVLRMGKGREAAMPASQESIARTLVERAREGKEVVRLKGGDPFVFGRGGEEMEVLAREGIAFEVVPGVTAALAAASHAGIPLTHRSKSSSLVFMTGHEDPEKEETRVRLRDLARTGGTLVIYMGMKNLEALAGQLMEAGMEAATPAVAVQWASTPRQRTVRSTLGALTEAVRTRGLESPSIIILGEVARDEAGWNWFESRPLFGSRIFVPRSRAQAGRLCGLLEERGAEAVELPLIEIEPGADPAVLSEVFAAIGSYEWIVFTSPNGVNCFFEYFRRAFKDLRALGGARLAAIGAATAREIERYHLEVDLVPEVAVAEALGRDLIATESLPSAQVLLVTGDRNREVLARMLEQEGEAIVDQLAVYSNRAVELKEGPELEALCGPGFDYVIFTSSSIVENYARHRHLLESSVASRRPRFLSLGPITSAAMRRAGLTVDLESPAADLERLVEALVEIHEADSKD